MHPFSSFTTCIILGLWSLLLGGFRLYTLRSSGKQTTHNKLKRLVVSIHFSTSLLVSGKPSRIYLSGHCCGPNWSEECPATPTWTGNGVVLPPPSWCYYCGPTRSRRIVDADTIFVVGRHFWPFRGREFLPLSLGKESG